MIQKRASIITISILTISIISIVVGNGFYQHIIKNDNLDLDVIICDLNLVIIVPESQSYSIIIPIPLNENGDYLEIIDKITINDGKSTFIVVGSNISYPVNNNKGLQINSKGNITIQLTNIYKNRNEKIHALSLSNRSIFSDITTYFYLLINNSNIDAYITYSIKQTLYNENSIEIIRFKLNNELQKLRIGWQSIPSVLLYSLRIG